MKQSAASEIHVNDNTTRRVKDDPSELIQRLLLAGYPADSQRTIEVRDSLRRGPGAIRCQTAEPAAFAAGENECPGVTPRMHLRRHDNVGLQAVSDSDTPYRDALGIEHFGRTTGRTSPPVSTEGPAGSRPQPRACGRSSWRRRRFQPEASPRAQSLESLRLLGRIRGCKSPRSPDGPID